MSADAILANEETKRDFQVIFRTPAGERVLEALSVFCRARETCLVPGDRDRTAALEGRREVFLYIMEWINLSPEEIYQLGKGWRNVKNA